MFCTAATDHLPGWDAHRIVQQAQKEGIIEGEVCMCMHLLVLKRVMLHGFLQVKCHCAVTRQPKKRTRMKQSPNVGGLTALLQSVIAPTEPSLCAPVVAPASHSQSLEASWTCRLIVLLTLQT